MTSLSNKVCVPCRGGIPPLSSSEANDYLSQVSDWELISDGLRIERRYQFNDFVSALSFTNSVGALAEKEGHHPDICVGWGYVNVVFYTHKINGLHENDFIMAAKTDSLFAA